VADWSLISQICKMNWLHHSQVHSCYYPKAAAWSLHFGLVYDKKTQLFMSTWHVSVHFTALNHCFPLRTEDIRTKRALLTS